MAVAVGVRETERKYEAPSEFELPAADLGAFQISGPVRESRLVARYYDTEDLRLLRAGVTLRRRTGGHDAGWHLKLPVDRDSREEVRLPLARKRHPPGELVGLVRVYTRDAPLLPVAELTTTRRHLRLADRDGIPTAELDDDRVHALVSSGDTGELAWREVEVELVAGAPAGALDAIEKRLLRLGLRHSRAGTKVGRALADRLVSLADHSVQGSSPPGARTAGAAVLGYLAAQAQALRRNDPLARRELPDAVHQMRVAARRMRSVLQACDRILDPGSTGELIGELRWLAGRLGVARDAEVMAPRVEAMLERLPDELRTPSIRTRIGERLDALRVQGRTAALDALDSDRYFALQDSIDALLIDPPLTGHARRPASVELRKSVKRAYLRLKHRYAALSTLPSGTRREVALHDMRKAAKRLRYTTELLAPIGGKPAARLLAALKPVQEILGEHQDGVVLRAELRQLSAAGDATVEDRFALGALYGLELAHSDAREAELHTSWTGLLRPKVSGWLG